MEVQEFVNVDRPYSETEYLAIVNDNFNEIKEWIIEPWKEEVNEKASNYANSKIDSFLAINEFRMDNTLEHSKAEIIVSSENYLKMYVKNLLQIETDIIALTKRLQHLYHKYFFLEAQRELNIEKIDKRKKGLNRQISKKEQELSEISITRKSVGIIDPAPPIKPYAPVYQKPGLFNKKRIEAENKRLEENYNDEIIRYQKEYEKYQAALSYNEKRFEEIVQDKKAQLQNEIDSLYKEAENINRQGQQTPSLASLLEKEITEAETVLSEAYLQRNNFYDLDIIFSKYRNPVALASFYEYLMAGRCSTLEGAGGAYNIYENEIHLNQITSKLDQILDSLEEIKQNQYIIYSELRKMNSSLELLNTAMDNAIESINQIESNTNEIGNKLGVIAHNSDVTAYYSKVNAYYSQKTAQLTNAIGWLIALK